MTDTPFTVVAESVDDLLAMLDLETVDEVETVLMYLLERPLTLLEDQHPENDRSHLHVVMSGADGVDGVDHFFPGRMLDLARTSGDLGRVVGPSSVAGLGEGAAPDVLGMTDDDLADALRSALGSARIFHALDD